MIKWKRNIKLNYKKWNKEELKMIKLFKLNINYQIKKLVFKKKCLIRDINNKIKWLNLNILIIHN